MFVYPLGLKALAEKKIDLSADPIKVLLVTSGYTPSASHEFVSDVTNELVASGYSRMTVSGVSSSVVSNNYVLDGNNLNLTPAPSSGTVIGHVVFVDLGADSASYLLGFDDTNYPQTFTGQAALNIEIPATGLFRILGG